MICYVCALPIGNELPHTYHAEGCPQRDADYDEFVDGCEGLDGCGEDCHAACCPTCNPVKLSWNCPCCERCWFEREGVWVVDLPGGTERLSSVRQPVRLLEAELEQCAFCGGPTLFGVYVRHDPTDVPYPKKERTDADT